MSYLCIVLLLQVYGSIEAFDGYERFEFQHSYSKVHPIPEQYSPGGIFMSFEFYNVEDRNRVKCLTGQQGKTMVDVDLVHYTNKSKWSARPSNCGCQFYRYICKLSTHKATNIYLL